MSSSLLQFQPGMSLPDFMASFGAEAQCREALRLARWPQGFVCPRCTATAHYVVSRGVRRRYQCTACGHQTSLTAGSLMDNTKLPLTLWFLAIYLISQAKTGISSLALMRQLGVSYPTAWLLHQKINRAMTSQDATHRLEGLRSARRRLPRR